MLFPPLLLLLLFLLRVRRAFGLGLHRGCTKRLRIGGDEKIGLGYGNKKKRKKQGTWDTARGINNAIRKQIPQSKGKKEGATGCTLARRHVDFAAPSQAKKKKKNGARASDSRGPRVMQGKIAREEGTRRVPRALRDSSCSPLARDMAPHHPRAWCMSSCLPSFPRLLSTYCLAEVDFLASRALVPALLIESGPTTYVCNVCSHPVGERSLYFSHP